MIKFKFNDLINDYFYDLIMAAKIISFSLEKRKKSNLI